MSEAQLLLPLWRGEEIIIFANLPSNVNRILEWVAVAKSGRDELLFRPTGRMRLSDDDLDKCKSVAQKFSDLNGRFAVNYDVENIIEFTSVSDSLIEYCGYLNLLRKYAVDLAILKKYISEKPSDRFSMQISQAINRIVLNYHLPALAQEILDGDLPIAQEQTGAASERAEYFRTASLLREMEGNFAGAAETMAQATDLSITEDKLRKLGDFQFNAGDFTAAAQSFLRAEELSTLPQPAAFRLGRILFELERFDEAVVFLERAESLFPMPVGRMLKAISAQ